MIEGMQEFVNQMRDYTEQERSWAIIWLIITLIGNIVLYVITGIIVWALGRRMIQAAAFAWKETRRDVT
jgi:uncharacterized Tic20 family protein